MRSWPEAAAHRWKALCRAGHNLNCLPDHEVDHDLTTDAGQGRTSSTNQPPPVMDDVLLARFGTPRWLATSSGRGAEAVVAAALLAPGRRVLSDELYVTGEWWVHRFGGVVEQLSARPSTLDDVAFVAVTAPRVRLTRQAGRPTTVAQLQELRSWLDERGTRGTRATTVPLVLDASRLVENAHLVGSSAHELASYADVLVLSARKDAGCDDGGLVLARDDRWWPALAEAASVLEDAGGGLTGAEVDQLAGALADADDVVGARVRARSNSVQAFADRLRDLGLPVLATGAGSIFLDASVWLPRVRPDQLPAQTLVNLLYLGSGIRALGTPAEESVADGDAVVRIAVRSAAEVIEEALVDLAERASSFPAGLLPATDGGGAPFCHPAEPVGHTGWPGPAFGSSHSSRSSRSSRSSGSSGSSERADGWLVSRSGSDRIARRALAEAWTRLVPGIELRTEDPELRALHALFSRRAPARGQFASSCTAHAGRVEGVERLLAARQGDDLVVVEIEGGGREGWRDLADRRPGVDAWWSTDLVAVRAGSALAGALEHGALFTLGSWLATSDLRPSHRVND